MSGARTLVRLARLPDAADDDQADWLTVAERERLATLRAPLRRRQFLAGHRLARELAIEHAGGTLVEWRLSADAAGAPRIDGPCNETCHVSLAHAGEWIAAAVSTQPVGLDVECPSRSRDLLAVARFTFGDDVARDLAALADAARAEAFYTLWTLAEAEGKHAGHGLRPGSLRGRAFRECADAEAIGISWQRDNLTVATWGGAGRHVEVRGWEAPAPRYWRSEPVADQAHA